MCSAKSSRTRTRPTPRWKPRSPASKKISTIRIAIAAFAALGFGVFALGSLQVLYLNDTLHVTDILERGIILSIAGFVAVPFLFPVGSYFDRTYRRDPAKALRIVGLLILPSALFTPLQVSTHSVTWFVIWGIPQAVLTVCAFAMVSPVLQAVCPYRLRGLGTAMGVMYVVFIGGFAGSILAAFFTNAIGVRGTVLLLGIPTSLIGGALLINGSRFIRGDLSLVVEELLEEQEEYRKRAEPGVETPVLQVANIDFSYGPVQVMFDVNFEIFRGECVALLGTNGAGKSTILRVISGLEVPERGVVRLNGRNITYVAPEQRVRHGIVQLPGGKGVFPSLTVQQNLAISARLLSTDKREVEARVDEVLTLFPELVERRAQPARSMSGGQQQMLALARVLIHRPEVLLIDELSLGLAPVVVQRMLELVDQLKERKQTMVIVEQSLNVALSISDRAIFLEKGEVKFEGSAQRADGARRPRASGLLRHRRRLMLASLLQPHIWTANIVFQGFIAGLSFALIAMGIVLVYRSSRIINFAVGDLGVPAAATVAILVAKSDWPYWLALAFGLFVGTVSGAVVELDRDPAPVQGAPRDRARRDDRSGRARPRRHAPTSRVPHRPIPEPVPNANQQHVAHRQRHRDRSAALDAHHRADRGAVPVVAARTYALRRRGARVGDQRRLGAAHGYQPEDDVDRDLDDRRLLVDDVGDPVRHATNRGALRRDRTRHVARRPHRRADRPHAIVPDRGHRRHHDRNSPAGALLQLLRPERHRPHAVHLVPRRADPRGIDEPLRRNGWRELRVRTARPTRPRAAARDLVGALHAATRGGVRPGRRDRDPAGHHAVVASSDATRWCSPSRCVRCRSRC